MRIMSKLKKLDIILVIVIIACLSSLGGLYLGLRSTGHSSRPLTAGWQYSWAEQDGINMAAQEKANPTDWQDIALPADPPKIPGNYEVWYKIKLPEDILPDAGLLFRTYQQTVRVYLDEDLVYSFGKIASPDQRYAPGNMWNIVKLPPYYAGKTVYIELNSSFPQFMGYLEDVQMGSQSVLITEIIRRHVMSVVLGSIFIAIGLACLAIYYFGKRFDAALQGLGFAAFFVGIWTIAKSEIVQFFIYAPQAWMYTAYIALYLAPVGYCIFYERFFSEPYSKIYRKLKVIFLLYAVFSLGLEATHVVSMFTTLHIFHILLVFSMLLSVILSVKSALKGNKEAAIMAAGFVVLTIAGLHDIITLYYPNILLADQRMVQWGMLIYLLISTSVIGGRLKTLYDAMAVNYRTNKMNYQGLFANMIDVCLYCQVISDEEGKPCDLQILEVNKTFAELWTFKKELLERKITEIIPSTGKKTLRILLGRLAKEEKNIELDEPVKIGKLWCKVSAFSPIPGYLCIILKDITANREAEELIRYQAYHDSITGLHNRMFFEQEIQRIEKAGILPTSIISVDLDGLKIVNDTFGHFTGDMVLKDAAKVLQSVALKDEYVTRVGGDEFALILPGVDNKSVQERGDEIIQAVEEYNAAKPLIPLSMSVGAATFNKKNDKNLYDVYRRADDNMYQYKMGQVSSTKSGVIEMLLAALAKKDYASEGHVERLANMAVEMAERLNLAAPETRRLVLLAKMHDVGKIGIPDDILFKPGKLTEEEFCKMKEHSRIGYSIANRISELSQIASLILHHHENWDGNGYPDGLKGKAIPVECRILSIIDAYDAMTCKRPYSNGRKKEEALEELQRCAGTQFDPAYVKIFVQIMTEIAAPD